MTEYHLDARFLLCPLPVLRAQKILKGMKSGDFLHIRGTNPDSLQEFEIFRQENDIFSLRIDKSTEKNWEITLILR